MNQYQDGYFTDLPSDPAFRKKVDQYMQEGYCFYEMAIEKALADRMEEELERVISEIR